MEKPKKCKIGKGATTRKCNIKKVQHEKSATRKEGNTEKKKRHEKSVQ